MERDTPLDVDFLRARLKAVADPLEFLANLFAYSPVGFAIATSAGRCFLINQAFMDIFHVAPPPEYSILQDDILTELGVMPYVRRAFSGEAVQTPVFWYDPRELKTIKVSEGRRVAFSMSLIPLFSREGRLEFVALTYKDETEVSLAGERLEKMSVGLEAAIAERTRDLESFVGSVSHDLRSPLRSISGFAAVLQEEHASSLNEECQGFLRRITETAGRMDQLIEGLLLFSRLGQKTLEVQEVSTGEIARQALDDLAADRVRGKVEVILGDLPSCRADPLLLKQVFINLINNAIKFTRHSRNAKVEVGSRLEGGERVWFVRDNGAGFDITMAEKLFEMFFRLHSPKEYEGTGIGLALVRRIIEKHGGRVWADSSPEKGAVFYFTLAGM